MKKIKLKIKTLLLGSVVGLSTCLLSSLLLSGCGSNKLKISILSHKPEIDKPLQELCRIYEQENPNIKIELQSIGGGNDYESNLLSKLNSKSVDMFCIEGLGNMMSIKSKLVDLTEMPLIKKCSSEILDPVTDENKKVYGFPVAIEGYGFMVNRAAFEAAGVDVTQIKSFAQFEESCKILKNAVESGKLKNKFPNAKTVWKFPGKATWSFANHALHVALAADFKNSLEAYNSPNLAFTRAYDYKKLIDFQTAYSIEGEPNKDKIANLNAVDYSASFDGSFLVGQSFACQQGTWVMPQVEKYDKDNKTAMMQEVDLLPFFMPGDADGGSKFVVLSGQNWAISNSSSEKQIELCKKFIEWLYSSEVAKEKMANEMKLISPVVSVDDLKNFKFDNVSQRIVDSYLSGNYIKGGSVGLVRTEGWSLQVFGTAVQEYLAGKIPFEEVIKRAQNGWAEKYAAQVKTSSN